MIIKKYKDFINESKEWIYEGEFTVTKEMIKDGHFIKGEIPDIINGVFNCSSLKMTTLEGSPKEVKGHFMCAKNMLTTLKGGPVKVGGTYFCLNNNLTTLEGGPKEVGGSFMCERNKLTSLEGLPKELGGIVMCNFNTGNLKLENKFIKSGYYKNDYYIDLLDWLIDTYREVEDIQSWPKGFLDSNINKTSMVDIIKNWESN